MRALFSLLIFSGLISTSSAGFAEDYPIFDGQKYNGLHYPRINVIEWGDPAYLVFNIYSKDKPVEVSGRVIERGTQKIFEIAYDLPFRNERLCRSVIAPQHFKVGQKLHFYSDKTDKEMNQIYVSAKKMKKKKYKAKEFSNCEPMKASVPKKQPNRAIASENKQPKRDMPVWFDENQNNNDLNWFGDSPESSKKGSLWE